jgi:diguanylate cyclase (GGDEF)-like protein/PAS domain S-box-containing protein
MPDQRTSDNHESNGGRPLAVLQRTPIGSEAWLAEIFEGDHEKHLDTATLERAFEAILDLHPDAPACALREDAVMVEMPASVKLRNNPVLEARAGTDLLAVTQEVLQGWERVMTLGASTYPVHPIAYPDVTSKIYALDLRENHGVIVTLSLFIPPELAEGGETIDVSTVASRFASVSKDQRSHITEVGKGLCEILGWEEQELLGHRTLDLIHPDDHGLAIDNWMEMLARPGPARRVRLRHAHTDGSWVWFEVTNHNLLHDPDHGCVVSEMVDISEEMATQEALREREQLLDRIAEAIPVGLIQVDSDRNVVYTNDRFKEILGVPLEAPVEEQLATVLESDLPVLEGALKQVLGEGAQAEFELHLQLPGESAVRLCSINLRALSHEDGSISGAIACVADITDSARMREELRQRATFDALTGCYNRASIMHALEADLAERPPGAERAVMFIDLDHFKSINDVHGHAAGDEMLSIVAERLREAVRGEDLVGRTGGDEFLVICPSIGGPDQAMRLANRLTEVLSEDVPLATGTVSHMVSVGVAWSGREQTNADELVARADAAMYESKGQREGQPRLARAGREIVARRSARARHTRATVR